MKQIKNKKAARMWRKDKKRRKLKLPLRLSIRSASNKKSKPITKRTILAFVGVLVCGVLIDKMLYSPYMRIKAFEISGTENVAIGEMEALVRDSMAEKRYGFIPGDHFLFQDEEEMEKKIKEKFPQIENVDVSLRFPDKIVLEIREQNMALVWCRDRCYFVNEEGKAFLEANEEELQKEQKKFIKVIEEANIAEESEEEKKEILEKAGEGKTQEKAASAGEIKTAEATLADMENNDVVLTEGMTVLPAVTLNEKVADAPFVSFAVETGNLLSRNPQVKFRYFKTKGYKTRELIAFTDQNTRLYFDTTKSAEKQAKNLDYLLSEAIESEKVDALRYVYLKNEDRVFYR